MQQYFSDRQLREGDLADLPEDVLYHLKKVLRKDERYVFRMADVDGRIFHAHLIDNNRCQIMEDLNEDNELPCRVTCILSLIKNDRFEWCLQKLTELGVSRIVPFDAERSVMKIQSGNRMKRFRKIMTEAAEQCHRNFVPELCEVAAIDELGNYLSEDNYICYEAEKTITAIDVKRSITYIIGPEGGFSEDEYSQIISQGYESLSLGRRILRAETAAIYMSCIIAGKCL